MASRRFLREGLFNSHRSKLDLNESDSEDVQIKPVVLQSVSEEVKIKTPVVLNLLVSPFKCNKCYESFYCSGDLKDHASIHEHSNQDQLDDSERFSINWQSSSSDNELRCIVCDRKFSDYQLFKLHQLLHRAGKLNDNSPERQIQSPLNDRSQNSFLGVRKKPHHCLICGAQFLNGALFRKHYATHFCSITDTVAYATARDTTSPIDTETNKKPLKYEQRHKCHVCDRLFSRPFNLRQHLITHTDGRRYMCPVCKKEYRHQVNVRRHLKKHFEGRTYQCHLCREIFKQESNLKEHYKLHTHTNKGEKLHQCELCEKPVSKHSLKRHYMTHNEEKPFECPVCSRRFKVLKYLRRHLRDQRCPTFLSTTILLRAQYEEEQAPTEEEVSVIEEVDMNETVYDLNSLVYD